ncbi:receptor-type tyrosine-protein phosphatase mu-like isoform X2 [Amblyomma americanum]
MFPPGVVFLFLFACFVGTSCQSIGCSETGETLLKDSCEYNQTCIVHCKSSCLTDTKARVYGTVHYALKSSVCKSALHDLRISAWNTSAMTASLKFFMDTRSDYSGSMRYGVASERNFIYGENTTSQLECHGPENRGISFDYTIKEVGLPSTVNLRPRSIQGAYILKWPPGINVDPLLRTNMFWCKVERSTLSNIGSPAMYFELRGGPTFLPLNYTVTASLSEQVALEVQAVPGVTQQPRVPSWTRVNATGFATDRIPRTGSDNSWITARVDISHNGVYVANGPNTGSPGKNRAIFRLLVRTCPRAYYGSKCNYQCPFCQNGGVCHDITGQCICPPGFRGELCETPCGDDYFGRECQRKCSNTNPDRNVKSCRGILICLPDPYGCSCGTGFHGPFCNETCPAHRYGADCKQSRVCFCKTEEFCNAHTGTCAKDRGLCRQGWRNSPFCDTSYPLFKDGPSVSTVTDKSATIRFKPWNSSVDIGMGKPKEYRVEYKAANATWNSKTVLATTTSTTLSALLSPLRSGTRYEVRVLVIDEDGHRREHGASTTHFRTACGAPAFPPQNVKIDNSSTSAIVVKWTNPPRESWNCWSVNVVLEVDGVQKEFTLTESGTTANDRYSIPLKPYTKVNIRLRLRTPDNKYSAWTKNMTVVSAGDAPTEPAYVVLKRSGSTDVEVTWGRPKFANGVIRHYRVLYKPLRLRVPDCALQSQQETEVIVRPTQTSANLIGLHPYTTYLVSVAAVTVSPGKAVEVTFDTLEAVPDGAPMGLYRSRSYGNSTTITWSGVPCQSANGPMNAYYVELESGDPWETELRRTTVKELVVKYEDLVPYTSYQAKVFAENSAGRSPKFATLKFRTDPAPPLRPADLRADQQSQDSVFLSWDAPYPPYGVLQGYQLQYWKRSDRSKVIKTEILQDTCRSEKVYTPRHCYTVTNLDPNVIYHFSVRALNKGNLYSAYSGELEVETREMPPEAPVNMQSFDQTEDSLRIQWEPPFRKKGALTSYKVNLSLSHSFNTMLANSWQPESVVLNISDKPEFYLRGLFPGSTYMVCVQASTSAGYGDAICGNISTKASPPEVQVEPMVEAIDNQTVTVLLRPVDSMKGPITGYYLVVVREGSSIPTPVRLVNYSTAEEMRLRHYVAAHLNPRQLKDTPIFVVGDGSAVGGFENPPLTDATPYRFGLLAETKFSGEVLYGYRLTAPVIVNGSGNEASTGVVIGAILGVLCLILAVTALTYYSIRKRQAVAYRSNGPTKRSFKERLSRLSKPAQAPKEKGTRHSRLTEYLPMMSFPSTTNAATAASKTSNPVTIKKLQYYVPEALADGSLLQEYANARSGPVYPASIAEREEKKLKNNSKDVLPYDHSRVVLTYEDRCRAKDYINASYVPGVINQHQYIAAQGPKPSTISYFWWMVWQEHASKVVMISGPNEPDVVAYWPESKQVYGAITVALKNTTLSADFVVREFELSMEGQIRSVTQFHYTTWPRGSVPPYTDSLHSFITAVRSSHPGDCHPTIVHGRESIGRTGTFILIDSMISQAEAEGEVDFLKQLIAIRHSRMNMVETAEQYAFAHKMMVEISCSVSRKLSVNEFLNLYPKLKAKHPVTGKTFISKEFERLGRVRPQPGASEYKAARDERNTSKNRTLKILASDTKRYLLSTEGDSRKTDYINAVYVDGFKTVNAYLVTQMPLPETVDDFWETVSSAGSVTIVTLGSLEHEKTPQFWPELGCSSELGGTTLEQMDSTEFPFMVVRTFQLSQNTKSPVIVKQFHCDTWKCIGKAADSCAIALDILRRVEQWQMRAEGAPIVVQCCDGCEECGVFCVLASICDQLKNEHEVDVCRCVERARASRPEFITNAEQYSFCYEVAHTFVECFNGYANFA